MCDKAEAADGDLLWRNLNSRQERAEARQATTAKLSKGHVISLLHGAARELEMQAAGVRRLADIVNVAGDHEYPLFAALIAVVRK